MIKKIFDLVVGKFIPNPKIKKNVIINVRKGSSFTIGENSEIRENSLIESANNGVVNIGDNVVVGFSNWLQGSGVIIIEDDVIIGPHCNIISTSHNFSDKKKSIVYQKLESGRVEIKKGAWIGAGVTVCMGVTIGEGAIIGANSFVNKSVPDFEIFAGVPAKKIGVR